MSQRRVVVTGVGVVSPNATQIDDFVVALKTGRSGIRYQEIMGKLKFACHVGGVPQVDEERKSKYFTPLQLRKIRSSGVIYGCIAGLDAWNDAGLPIPDKDAEPDWDSGTIFGTGMAGIDLMRECIYKVDDLKVRRVGATVVEQVMESGISAHLGGMLGLGNRVSTNSSACSTGTEAILVAYEHVASGRAKRMLAGSCNSHGPYAWGGFDSMRVLDRNHNHVPEKASRPMSASAGGFIPGSGAAALVLETLEDALDRGAQIYAEILGGALNAGGHRQGGGMTAPNPTGVIRCIQSALEVSGIMAGEIDLISGHLTATMADPLEVLNWSKALGVSGKDFPMINSTKSMVGHCLGAAGAIESVAVVLQLHHGFIHPSINCEDVHPEILEIIDETCIPQKVLDKDIQVVAKSSFGFGDVNSCVLFGKQQWKT